MKLDVLCYLCLLLRYQYRHVPWLIFVDGWSISWSDRWKPWCFSRGQGKGHGGNFRRYYVNGVSIYYSRLWLTTIVLTNKQGDSMRLLSISQRQYCWTQHQQLCTLREVSANFTPLIWYFSGNIFLLWTILVIIPSAASVFIKMKKPNAAIRDATAALEVIFNTFDCLYYFYFWAYRQFIS